MDQVASQLPSTKSIVNALAGLAADGQWIPEDCSAQLRSTCDAMPALESQCARAANLLSTMMVANSVLAKSSLDTSRRFSAERLRVDLSSLPDALKGRMQPQAAASGPVADDAPACEHTSKKAEAPPPPNKLQVAGNSVARK